MTGPQPEQPVAQPRLGLQRGSPWVWWALGAAFLLPLLLASPVSWLMQSGYVEEDKLEAVALPLIVTILATGSAIRGLIMRQRMARRREVTVEDLPRYAGQTVTVTGTTVEPVVQSPWSNKTGVLIVATEVRHVKTGKGKRRSVRQDAGVLGQPVIAGLTGQVLTVPLDGGVSLTDVPEHAAHGLLDAVNSGLGLSSQTVLEAVVPLGVRVWVTGRVRDDGTGLDSTQPVTVGVRSGSDRARHYREISWVSAAIAAFFAVITVTGLR